MFFFTEGDTDARCDILLLLSPLTTSFSFYISHCCCCLHRGWIQMLGVIEGWSVCQYQMILSLSALTFLSVSLFLSLSLSAVVVVSREWIQMLCEHRSSTLLTVSLVEIFFVVVVSLNLFLFLSLSPLLLLFTEGGYRC